MKRADVLKRISIHNNHLAEHYRVKALYLFGSVARDEGGQDSDVDLMVEFIEPIGLFHFISLQHELEAILGCPVDLGTQRSLKRSIQEIIKAEAIRVA